MSVTPPSSTPRPPSRVSSAKCIAPGAFRKTIQESDVRALFNHDPNFVLGRNKAGTLRLYEDGDGLGYEVDLPDTQAARDVYDAH